MPSNVLAKIKSARKVTIVGLVGLVFIGLLGIWGLMQQTAGTQQPVLHVGDRAYQLEVVDTPAKRERGLSGRSSLASNQGMLFVFDSEVVQCFWMKDMRFSIDIIWLSTDKKVLHIEHDASPETYPNSFCPEVPGRYVIELPAGEAQKAKIEQGSTLHF
jgi:uncharacterized membrane protein (UPF0127 family)